MEKFLKKNLKWITLIFIFLFCIKSFQSCLRKTEITRLEKTSIYVCDSLLNEKNIIIDSLENGWEVDLKEKDYMIKDLINDLKIAGVKVDAADKRANAVQSTAEKIRANTTIEIKTQENKKDTLENKK